MSVLIWTEGYARTLGDPETDPWADDGTAPPAPAPLPLKRKQGQKAPPDIDDRIIAAAEAIEAEGGYPSYTAVAKRLGYSLPGMRPRMVRLAAEGRWTWRTPHGGRPPRSEWNRYPKGA